MHLRIYNSYISQISRNKFSNTLIHSGKLSIIPIINGSSWLTFIANLTNLNVLCGYMISTLFIDLKFAISRHIVVGYFLTEYRGTAEYLITLDR